jgi:hypothetical protein
MSRAIKVLWIVIGCVFVVGVILTVAGFALGATGSAWLDRTGLHFGGRELHSVELAGNAEAFEDIDIAMIRAEVEIVSSNNYGYALSYQGIYDPTVEVRNGKLSVLEDSGDWQFGLGDWRIGLVQAFNPEEAQGTVLTVYVPRDAQLDSVTAVVASGGSVFNGNGIAIRSLDYKSASGAIELRNLKLESLQLDTASGDVSLDEVTATDASLNLISGGLVGAALKLENLTLQMTSGDVSLAGEITKNLSVNMVSGDVSFELDGNEDDYRCNVSSISGSVRINGWEVEGSSWRGQGGSGSNNASARIEIESISGSVNIDFRG